MKDEERVTIPAKSLGTEVDKTLRPFFAKGYILTSMEVNPNNKEEIIYILKLRKGKG